MHKLHNISKKETLHQSFLFTGIEDIIDGQDIYVLFYLSVNEVRFLLESVFKNVTQENLIEKFLNCLRKKEKKIFVFHHNISLVNKKGYMNAAFMINPAGDSYIDDPSDGSYIDDPLACSFVEAVFKEYKTSTIIPQPTKYTTCFNKEALAQNVADAWAKNIQDIYQKISRQDNFSGHVFSLKDTLQGFFENASVGST